MADLRDLRNQVRVRAYYAVSDASPRLEQQLRMTSPRDTGLMQQRTTVSPRGLVATATAATPYASFVRIPGTRPHVIRAKKGKLLSFYWPKAAKQMFLPKVNHPGYRGSDWWDVALRRWPDLLREGLRRAPS
jgi:hypothetical protein